MEKKGRLTAGFAKEKRELASFGKDLVDAGLTYAHFGNMSCRKGEKIFITKTGARLDRLGKGSFVVIDMKGPGKNDALASVECDVHRRIFRITGKNVILHGHAPYAVALSLLFKKNILPCDSEGRHFLGDIPVINGASGTAELGEALGRALKERCAVINKGHGIFASAETFEKAFVHLSMAEHSVKILYYKTVFERCAMGANIPLTSC